MWGEALFGVMIRRHARGQLCGPQPHHQSATLRRATDHLPQRALGKLFQFVGCFSGVAPLALDAAQITNRNKKQQRPCLQTGKVQRWSTPNRAAFHNKQSEITSSRSGSLLEVR